jgi:WASH complex subunit strumpellin
VVFVRRVLHIIPISIFGVLNKIVNILVNNLKECPTKLARKDLKAQCQLDVRHQLARHTSDISKFAKGILAMESTLVGVIQVDPHRLLEDGIRKELTRQISHELHKSLKFDPKTPLSAEELDRQLEALAKQLHGIQASFEYIQDYVNVHGLRIWIEEFTRIVNFNVDMEANSFMQKKIYHWNSKYQSDSIPIPYFERESEKETYSILGRLVQHILALTDPRRTIYVPALGSWYELATNKEVVGTRTFTSITSAVGTTGLSALDRLFCFLVARDLQLSIAGIRKHVEPLTDLVHKLQAQLSPPSSMAPHAMQLYESLIQPMDKALAEITDVLIRVGRIQLTRNLIASELRSCAKLNSGSLFNTLSTANTALLADLNRHYSNPSEHQMPGDIIGEICPFLDNVGLSDAQSKVYVTSKPIPEIPLVLVALLVRNLGRVAWDERLSALVSKKKEDSFDAAPFAYGVMLLLKQFHTDMRELFMGHVAQLVRSTVADFEAVEPKIRDRDVLPESAENVTHFANIFVSASGGSLDELHRTVPPHLLGVSRLGAARK